MTVTAQILTPIHLLHRRLSATRLRVASRASLLQNRPSLGVRADHPWLAVLVCDAVRLARQALGQHLHLLLGLTCICLLKDLIRRMERHLMRTIRLRALLRTRRHLQRGATGRWDPSRLLLHRLLVWRRLLSVERRVVWHSGRGPLRMIRSVIIFVRHPTCQS